MTMISCLMPCYNRAANNMRLLEESIESFLRQDHPDKELIVCNDTPGQTLRCDRRGVVVLNMEDRFPTLSDKLQHMIGHAQGDYLCRWDDDDICLPHRLSYSLRKLSLHTEKLEWRATNYWYVPTREGGYHYVNGPGNTHCMALWNRRILDFLEWGPGLYPQKMSGWEDQEFNRSADRTGYTTPEEIPAEDIFYLYRWGSSPVHLSGEGGGPEKMQAFYDKIGQRPVKEGLFEVTPKWRTNYVQTARQAAIANAKK